MKSHSNCGATNCQHVQQFASHRLVWLCLSTCGNGAPANLRRRVYSLQLKMDTDYRTDRIRRWLYYLRHGFVLKHSYRQSINPGNGGSRYRIRRPEHRGRPCSATQTSCIYRPTIQRICSCRRSRTSCWRFICRLQANVEVRVLDQPP